jgi:hypothetical protein
VMDRNDAVVFAVGGAVVVADRKALRLRRSRPRLRRS